MKKIASVLTLFVVLLVGLMACNKSSFSKSSSDKLKVVTTNSILADITKNIAGDKIDLHSIVPVGQDPH
ncbi:zinc ABC transporter substrate-binding protein, partial [Streptococcus vestibularis]|nr:zinc ABC transporter substrate-binding protein [Streptococcus vestibularis]